MLNFIGFALNHTPKLILITSCWALSIGVFLFFGSRRKLVKRNLQIAFPEFSYWQIKVISIKTINRTIEQGLLIFAWPFLSENRIKRSFLIPTVSLEKLNRISNSGSGVLWLIPHFCHADAISCLKPEIQVNALYRPLRNTVFNDFVKRSRQRFGIRTIDRKNGGMIKTLRVLRNGEILAMLFDQNAGGAGTRLLFMGKKCSCTTLPDILNEKYKPRILFVYTRRVGFWGSSIEVEEMENVSEGELVIEKANKWLEDKLTNDKALRDSWLWMHQRWKAGAGKPKKGKIR